MILEMCFMTLYYLVGIGTGYLICGWIGHKPKLIKVIRELDIKEKPIFEKTFIEPKEEVKKEIKVIFKNKPKQDTLKELEIREVGTQDGN